MKREIKSSLKGRMALTLTVTFLIFTFVLLLVIRFVSTQGIKSFVLNHIHARQAKWMRDGHGLRGGFLFPYGLNEDLVLFCRMSLCPEQRRRIFQDLDGSVGVNTELLGDVPFNTKTTSTV